MFLPKHTVHFQVHDIQDQSKVVSSVWLFLLEATCQCECDINGERLLNKTLVNTILEQNGMMNDVHPAVIFTAFLCVREQHVVLMKLPRPLIFLAWARLTVVFRFSSFSSSATLNSSFPQFSSLVKGSWRNPLKFNCRRRALEVGNFSDKQTLKTTLYMHNIQTVGTQYLFACWFIATYKIRNKKMKQYIAMPSVYYFIMIFQVCAYSMRALCFECEL